MQLTVEEEDPLRAQGLYESRGGRLGFHVLNKLRGYYGRKAINIWREKKNIHP